VCFLEFVLALVAKTGKDFHGVPAFFTGAHPLAVAFPLTKCNYPGNASRGSTNKL
jgi:hypothetical protein